MQNWTCTCTIFQSFLLNNIGFIFSWDSVACPYLYFASLPSNQRLLICHLIYLKLSCVPQALRLDSRLAPLIGLILGTFHLNYYPGPRLQFWLHFHEALLFANSDDFGSLCHLVYRFHPKKYHNVKLNILHQDFAILNFPNKIHILLLNQNPEKIQIWGTTKFHTQIFYLCKTAVTLTIWPINIHVLSYDMIRIVLWFDEFFMKLTKFKFKNS